MQLLRRNVNPSGPAGPTKPQGELDPRRWLEVGFPRAFAWLATTIYGMTGDWRSWLPLFTRTSAHLAVVAVAIIAVGFAMSNGQRRRLPP